MNLKVYDVRHHQGDSAFLIDDGKTSILYDTGFGFTGYAVADNIRAILGERALDYIFLSHSHYDHALGSAYILRRYPTAKVVAGKHAVGVFQRDGAKRTMKALDAAFAAKCGVSDYEFLGDELRVDIALDDGDIVRAGDLEFEAIHLPGHTRCCFGYLCEKEGFFLPCETLGCYDGEDLMVPSFLVSYTETIASIEKIEKRSIASMLAPHYGLLDEAQTAFFLGSMKSAAEKLAQELLEGIHAGLSDEEIIEQYKARYWRGYIKDIYPEDAVALNTSIMLRLIKNELL